MCCVASAYHSALVVLVLHLNIGGLKMKQLSIIVVIASLFSFGKKF